jgi:hypothetical protein
VILTAQPGLLPFRGWSGACSGSSTTCTVVMSTDKAVTATFAVLLAESAAVTRARWTSVLDAPGAAGRVFANGAAAGAAGRAPAALETTEAADGVVRVEGILEAASGPGTWRFDRAGSAPVRLKVIEGRPALVTPSAVVFRVDGRPGERVSFAVVPVR